MLDDEKCYSGDEKIFRPNAAAAAAVHYSSVVLLHGLVGSTLDCLLNDWRFEPAEGTPCNDSGQVVQCSHTFSSMSYFIHSYE